MMSLFLTCVFWLNKVLSLSSILKVFSLRITLQKWTMRLSICRTGHYSSSTCGWRVCPSTQKHWSCFKKKKAIKLILENNILGQSVTLNQYFFFLFQVSRRCSLSWAKLNCSLIKPACLITWHLIDYHSHLPNKPDAFLPYSSQASLNDYWV